MSAPTRCGAPGLLAGLLLLPTLGLGGCGGAERRPGAASSGDSATAADSSAAATEAFLDDVQRRTFDWFWNTTNPQNGLVPDRWPSQPFSSIAAVGFGLTAYPVGVRHGWISREEASARTLTTLRFLWNAPQGPGTTGVTGYEGFFYHFLDMQSGLRHQTTELSTIDTSLLLAGVLFAQSYYDGDGPAESEIRALADSIYRRADWTFFQHDDAAVRMGWHPEPGRGWIDARWIGYNEALILLTLALGSPTHPVGTDAWDAWVSGYDAQWGAFEGQTLLNFAPLFGHQYSHVWIDFRGIPDAFMRDKGIDYFENSRRATLAQRAYAIDNPSGWSGYGEDVWGLTASDGPKDTTVVIGGTERRIHSYWARGAALDDVRDDGTIAPTAAGGSVAFAPEIAIPALQAMRARWSEHLYGQYGFKDAFNPTLSDSAFAPRHGEIVPGVGWFDDEYLGIDQGPILLMIENHRSGFVWDTMKRNPYIVRGLCRAGFGGGWLEGRCP